uniref:Uncharacterized protein n=1 Tax=Cyprinus carpio TaxID=7962 RepID=A0A8C2EFI3_CYPCA
MLHTITGAIYLQDCPQQDYIPVYVLVCGVFSVFLALLSCLVTEQGSHTALSHIRAVFSNILFIGSVWIYSIYPPNYNQTLAGVPYCNKTLYLFAFWTTTLGYIFLGGALLIGCCFCICACIRCLDVIAQC